MEERFPIESLGSHATPVPSTGQPFAKIGVVGCGILGQEIIRLAALSGFEVTFLDLHQEVLEKCLQELRGVMDHLVRRWELTEGEKRSVLGRLKPTLNYRDFADADIVIEAIKSKTRETAVAIRKEIFQQIEQVVRPDTIIATNSTTLVITELSNDLTHPQRCVSLHFISPVHESKVVEVVCGLHTTRETFCRVVQFARQLNKRVVRVTESPGIISTRLVAPLINEACGMLMEGVGTVDDIDATLRLGFGFPLGPFEMADKYGVDRVVRWLDNLYGEFGELHYKASPLLKKMIRANRLGKVVGHGFYHYDAYGNKIPPTHKTDECRDD